MRMDALLAWAGKDCFSVGECEELAKDLDAHDSMTFELVGPKGRIKARWLDAYFGFIQLNGSDGFCSSRDFKYARDVHCENLEWPSMAAKSAAKAIEARSDATGTGAAEGKSAGRKASPKTPRSTRGSDK